MIRGYFGIAVYRPKTAVNVGTLWRTAHLLGADFIATIGHRYKYQASDTLKSTKHVPLFEYESFADFKEHLPKDCRLVAVELDDRAALLDQYKHPERAIYLLGAEDHGIPEAVLNECHDIVKMRGEHSMNMSVAGSIVLYHRTLEAV